MGLLKSLWQGFVGDTDFTQIVAERFILEDKLLKVTIPASQVVIRQVSKEVNYHYRNNNWFAGQQQTHIHETYVHIYTELWMSLTIIGIFPSSVFRIKKIPDRINALYN